MATIALFLQAWAVREGYDTITQQTMVFTLLCFGQLANVLSVRSGEFIFLSKNFFSNKGLWGAVFLTILLQIAIVYTPVLHPIFKTTSLYGNLMVIVLAATGVCLLGYEGIKLIMRRLQKVNPG